MIVSFDYFGRPNPPLLYLCLPDNTRISVIPRFDSLDFNFEFNSVSEINLKIYEYVSSDIESSKWEFYKNIDIHKQIWVEGIGYFIITDCRNYEDGYEPYCTVTATSCEIEINNKNITVLEGVYRFWNSENPNDNTTILSKVLEKIPTWSVGTIDVDTAAKHRVFDDTSSPLYDFLMNNLEDRYECFFNFDIEDRKINVISKDSTVDIGNLRISFDNFIHSIEMTSVSSDVLTGISVRGDGNLTIRNVNPIGGEIIYKFDFFKDDMPTDLKNAITLWENKVSSKQEDFANAILKLQEYGAEVDLLEQKLIVLQSQKETYESIIDLRQSNGTDYSEIQSELNKVLSDISSTTLQKSEKEGLMAPYQTQIEEIQDSLTFENNFTEEQIKGLNPYIIIGDYTDDNIIITDSMSYAQRQEQVQSLYDRGMNQLKLLSEPRGEFEVSSDNFLFINEFKPYANELILGRRIYVELTPGNLAPFLLLKYSFSFDSNELKLTFSNRGKLQSSIISYSKLYGEVSNGIIKVKDEIEKQKDETSETISDLENTITGIETTVADVLKVGELTAKNLQANKAEIDQALINKADVEDLNATNAQIDTLTGDFAALSTLVTGSATIDEASIIVLTSKNTTIENAVIKNQIAAAIQVEDLLAGDISTNKFKITSDSGNIVIYDNTMQINDGTNVRVQIGKNSQDDYTISVWDAEGNLMFDAGGITEDAIKEPIIRDDMVSNNANISGSKINIASLVTEINNGTSTIESNRVSYDGKTLDITFQELNQAIEDGQIAIGTTAPENPSVIGQLWQDTSTIPPTLKSWDGTTWKKVTDLSDIQTSIEGLTTDLTIEQGRIDAIISDMSIENDDGETIKLKEAYSNLSTSVDSINMEVGYHKTTIDELGERTETLSSKIDQTAENITMSFQDSQKILEEKIDNNTKEIEEGAQNLTDYKNLVSNYIRFDVSGITLGTLSSPFTAVLSNEKLSFFQDSDEVAYVGNKKLYITEAEINNTLSIGTPNNGMFNWIPRENGNLSLVWKNPETEG